MVITYIIKRRKCFTNMYNRKKFKNYNKIYYYI